MNSGRVLLVDDEKYVLRSLKLILCSEGYTVGTAPNGEEAVRMLDKEDYDAVVSDIKMWPVDGMELLRLLKAGKPNLSVILLTGFGAPGTASAALKYDVYDYLIKPVNTDELLRAVAGAVARTRALMDGKPEPPRGSEPSPSLRAFLRDKEDTYTDDVPKLIT
ncbi:MAG: response regulator [Lentisphaerae bacterium]|nr:response regulator [Lentisphaerota bacterium]